MSAFTAYTILDGTSTPQSVQFFTTPGQTTSALSMPVVLASDQPAVSVAGAGAVGSAPPTTGSYVVWNNSGSLSGSSVTAPFPVGIAGSYFTSSTVNSSTTQLAASATFTGTVETIYNQPAISILLTSDQPGTLTLNQYIDAAGLYLAQSNVFTNTAGVPISRALIANGNYFRASYQNTGASTTTTFNLNTAYGDLEPQTALGNLPVSLQEYGGAAISTGNPIPVAAALSASTNNIGTVGNTQGSTTSGQYGPLTQGAVTTAAPSYTTAQTNPLSLTTGGGLRGDMASYAGTALTGTVTAYGTAPTGNVFGVNAYITNTPAVTISSGAVTTVSTVTTVTTVSTVTSLSQIATKAPLIGTVANGSTNFPLGVSMATAVSQTDQSATAFAGSGSVTGTVVASAQGGGGTISAEINVSALTLGTATAVFLILQESRGGTNYTDIWTSDPFTATGIQSMPAIPVAGRRRWRAFSCGGTSTTVTVTITSLELAPGPYPLIRQARDFYAATNPLASQFNSVALTASNFVLTTLSTATTPLYVEGAKVITAFMLLAGGPTVTTQPIVTLQGSMDGSNWVTVTGATMTAAGNGLYSSTTSNVAFKFVRLQVTTAAVYGSGSYTITNIGVNATN